MKSPLRPGAAAFVAIATSVALFTNTGGASAQFVPADSPDAAAAAAGGAPTLSPRDGAYLEGIATIEASPTVADDSVDQLTVDGEPLNADPTTGTSHLTFDVGLGTEARYGNWVVINDDYQIELPEAASERVALEVPNDELVTGNNTVTFHSGSTTTSCGENHDDFDLSDIQLELLGETADGEANEYSYSFGDGRCGDNTSKLLEAELTFTISRDPQRTTGLSADLDTTTLDNGSHEIAATAESGETTTHTVTVNNAPAGAPRLLPVDGTLTNKTQPVFAFLRPGDSGEVTGITVDGEAPPARETLAPGTATVGFTVGGNSVDPRYYNHLLINGHRVDIGGDWVSERVELSVPNQFLVPGENVITVVVGDINGTRNGERCANLDDFTLSEISLAPATGTATAVDLEPSYDFGDGLCGSDDSKFAQAELRFAIADAETTTLRPTLGGGDATLSMYIGSDSVGADARYGNYVEINGMRTEIGNAIGETVELTIPNEWLHPGTNTIEVGTGTFSTSCGDNHDDFSVSDLTLTPATGDATSAYRQTLGSGEYEPIQIGDGGCGDSYRSTTSVAIPFVVDAPEGGLRVNLDTAQLEDGEHTIAATSAAGTATRVLFTDNTAPQITDSVPTAGQSLTEGVVFDAVVDDASGVDNEPSFTLDGEPLSPGDLVGPGLGAGEHTIAVTLTDVLGNTADRTITFSSVGLPYVPTGLKPDNNTVVKPGKVDLRATVESPDGGDVTARFSRAKIVNPTAGFTGTAAAIPTTLRIEGESGVDISAVEPLDGASLESPASSGVTFQRYDFPIAAKDDKPVLRWNGTLDPERVATLRAWDPTDREWVALASSRGTFEGLTQISAPVAPRFVDGDVVHVLITGEDPFADDMEPRNPDAFADPSDYDFSLVHFTDQQYITEGAVARETAEERAIWKKAYADIPRWIKNNTQRHKIAHVMHTGDLIEDNYNAPTTPEMEEKVTREFELVSELQGILDEAGIPNQVIAGNHDNQNGTETGPSAKYNEYFGPERYESADQQWANAEYGGPWREGDNQNNYVLFTAGGLDFVAVGLSYGVTKAEADWANGILNQYADRNAIVMTHDYMHPSGNADGRGSTLAPDGSLLYKKLVEANPNVFLVLAGHRHGVGTNVKPEVGQVGNGVVELLADYQYYTVSAEQVGLTEIGGYKPDDQLLFGASFLRLLQFDVDRSELIVDTYSPFLDEFDATEYDDMDRYDGTEDDMVLPIDLSSRSTSFTTEAVSVLVPGEEVGTDTVASGDVASVPVKGLDDGSLYGWIVAAQSASGGRAVTGPAIFRTSGQADKDPQESTVVATPVEREVPAGEDIVLDVAVKPDEPAPTGEIEVREGGAVVATGELGSNGTVQLTWAADNEIGTRTYVVHYLGSDEHAPTTSEVTIRVVS